jgi:hypothetical protein
MSASASSHWDYEVRLLAWLAVCVSVLSFLFYFRRGDVLLYGDAIAHINIARRVFDSKTPGLLQLGTVWLPLPHLVMMPFLISDEMWRRGVGGSIPSMAAYVFGVVGMFRLVRGALASGEARDGKETGTVRVAAWTAALVYGANPNLIYMQTTAMGEALYLAFFIWATVYFSEFLRGDAKALTKCGLCLVGACLTRYDGWFLAGVLVLVAVALSSHFYREHAKMARPMLPIPSSRTVITKFVLLAAAGPALWLAYNAAVYRNPLEFANGPYSAKAIERKTATVNPAKGNLLAAGLYFLRSAELNVAQQPWLGRLWLALAVAGGIAICLRGAWPLLLLWLPLPFYAMSLAYGAVPIFVPIWWPFSYYNVRYGLELLPAFAAGLAVLVGLVLNSYQPRDRLRMGAVLAVLGVAVAGYGSIWQSDPICYREAALNMRQHLSLDRQLAKWLMALPPDATLLMYMGDHVGAVQQAGIPFKRVINEGNHRVWKQPLDPEGLWERALANPAAFADYAVAFEGDAVWQAVQGRQLKELVEVKVTGQPRAILYRAR